MEAKRYSKKVPRRPEKIHSQSQESVSDEEEMTMSCKCPECKKEVAEEIDCACVSSGCNLLNVRLLRLFSPFIPVWRLG